MYVYERMEVSVRIVLASAVLLYRMRRMHGHALLTNNRSNNDL